MNNEEQAHMSAAIKYLEKHAYVKNIHGKYIYASYEDFNHRISLPDILTDFLEEYVAVNIKKHIK